MPKHWSHYVTRTHHYCYNVDTRNLSDCLTGTITVDGFKQPISVDPFAVHNVIIIIVKIIIEKQLCLKA